MTEQRGEGRANSRRDTSVIWSSSQGKSEDAQVTVCVKSRQAESVVKGRVQAIMKNESSPPPDDGRGPQNSSGAAQ